MKRKALAFILSFALLMTVCVPGAFAAETGEPVETIETVKTEAGEADEAIIPYVEEAVETIAPEENVIPEETTEAETEAPVETFDIPDGAISIAKGDDIHYIEMKPGETVTFAFVNNVPDFVRWKLGTSPWAEFDNTGIFGDLDIAGAFVQYRLPETTTPGEQYAIGVQWHDNVLIGGGQPEPLTNPQNQKMETVAVIIVAGETADGELNETTESGLEVSVGGNLPVGAKLVLTDANVKAIPGFDNQLYGVGYSDSPYVAFDISLMQNGNKVQPGSPVDVSVDVSKLGLEDGDEFVVYHVHEGQVEELGPFTSDGVTASFMMDGFSYVIVSNSTYKVENVQNYYPATGNSGNNNIAVNTLYYDADGNAHLIVSGAKGNTDLPQADIKELKINGVSIGNVTKVGYQGITYIRVEGQNDNLMNAPTDKGTWIWDINLGKNVDFGKEFDLDIDTGSGGWNVSGLKVDIGLDYTITKEVASGSSAAGADFSNTLTVERGDWVIYKITVDNKGTQPLNGMTVTDILPDDVFVEGTKMMGVGDEDGNIPDWESFNETLFSDYNSPGDFTRSIYIKAQVKPDLDITATAKYINTAKINGMNMPEQSDTATITVNPPKVGTLVVRKTVTTENPLDTVPDEKFSFTVTYGDNQSEKFELKNGESKEISNFPVGNYTVAETAATGYTTTVNGTAGNTFSGEMTNGGSPVVAFENKLSKINSGLTITKTGWDTIDENQTFIFHVKGLVEHENIDLRVIIQGNGSKTIKDLPAGTYIVTEETGWSWRYTPDADDKTVTLSEENNYTGSVTFTNTRQTENSHTGGDNGWKWLNGAAYALNKFSGNIADTEVE